MSQLRRLRTRVAVAWLLLGTVLSVVLAVTGTWFWLGWQLTQLDASTTDLVKPSQFRVLSAEAIRSAAPAWAARHGATVTPDGVRVWIEDDISPKDGLAESAADLRDLRSTAGANPIVLTAEIDAEVSRFGVRRQRTIHATARFSSSPSGYVATGARPGTGQTRSGDKTSASEGVPAQRPTRRPGLEPLLNCLDVHRSIIDRLADGKRPTRGLEKRWTQAVRVLRADWPGPWLETPATTALDRYLVEVTTVVTMAATRPVPPLYERHRADVVPYVNRIRARLTAVGVHTPPI